MEDKIKQLSKIYSLSEEKFQEYYKQALLVLKMGNRPSKNKTITIIGGQSGAGKTRLIPLAKQALDNNAVIVDFDELRALHPHYREVCNSYPEITHRILHPDTEKVKNAVLENLRNEEYNVIYEGALRNTKGFLDFAREFKEKGYDIRMSIIAVPKLESYGSTFVRYATEILSDINARWVEKDAHDGSYDGVVRTVKAFIDEGLSEKIEVFIRGEELPQRIYSPQERQFKDPIAAIMYGRDIRRKKAIEDFPTKFKTVKAILEDRKPELIPNLKDWENLYDAEMEYFNNKGEESKIND